MARLLPIAANASSRTYAWAAYALLAVGSLVPVVCVIWLVQKTALREREAVAQLVSEAYERRLDDAEAAILRGFEGALEAAEEQLRSVGAPGDGRSELAILESGAADGIFVWRKEETDTDAPADDAQARAWLKEVRSLLESGQYDALLAALRAPGVETLRLGDGRNAAILAAMVAFEGSEAAPAFREECVALLDRLATADLPMPRSQRLYFLRRYESAFQAAGARRAAAGARRLGEWRNRVAKSALLPTQREFVAGADFVAVAEPDREFALLYERDSFLAACRRFVTELDAAMGVWEADPPEDARALERPLGFVHVGWLPEAAPQLQGQGAGAGRFYVWIGGIVLALSVVSSGLIALLVRRQLGEAQLKNDLVATVSHELKTPVASIRLLVDTLLDESRKEFVDTREYLELVARENARLGRLIDNFLAFSRMERGGGSFAFEALDPSVVLEEAAQAFRERFHDRPFDLTVTKEAGVRRILADADSLKTALGNLLENAFKYGGREKRIALRLAAGESGARFAVQDFGAGVARKDRKRIFGKFNQVDRDRPESSGGVGLGLSIVSFIVSKHKGRVSLESEVGRGSVFEITIPYA